MKGSTIKGGGKGRKGGGNRSSNNSGSEEIIPEGTDGATMAVGYVALGDGCADLANYIAKSKCFTDGNISKCSDPQTPLDIQSHYCPDQSRVHVYLSSSGVTPLAINTGYHKFSTSRDHTNSSTIVDYTEDRLISYLRSLCYMLMVCHVILFIHPPCHVSVDLGVLKLLRICQTIRQGIAPAVTELTRIRYKDILCGSQFSPGRLLPIVVFIFQPKSGFFLKPWNGNKLKPREKRNYQLEQSLSSHIRQFLRSTKLLGTASDRDGPETPILMLDPVRCCFVVDKYDPSCLDNNIKQVHDFIGRQAQYILRQMVHCGKRYELPTVSAWCRESSVLDSIIRLDNKLVIAHNNKLQTLAQHNSFSKLHPMLNPLYKLSYSRCSYGIGLAMESVSSNNAFASAMSSNDKSDGPSIPLSSIRQQQWTVTLALYERYALGPLRRDMGSDLKYDFNKAVQLITLPLSKGGRGEAAPSFVPSKGKLKLRDSSMGSIGSAVGPTESETITPRSRLLTVRESCKYNAEIPESPEETSHDQPIKIASKERKLLSEKHQQASQSSTSQRQQQHQQQEVQKQGQHQQQDVQGQGQQQGNQFQQVSTCGTALLTVRVEDRDDQTKTTLPNQVPFHFALHTTCNPDIQLVAVSLLTISRSIPTTDSSLVEWFHSNMVQKSRQARPSFRDVQKVGIQLVNGSPILCLAADAKIRWGQDSKNESQVKQQPGTELEGGAVTTDPIFDMMCLTTTKSNRLIRDGDGSVGKKLGKRARTRRPHTVESVALNQSDNNDQTYIVRDRSGGIPISLQSHATFSILLQYVCIATGVRWSLETNSSLLLCSKSAGDVPLPSCDVPLFVPSPSYLGKRDYTSQLQRIYVITDNTDACWSFDPTIAFFRSKDAKYATNSTTPISDLCHSDDDQEVLHELIKSESPVSLPLSSILCFTLPRNYPVDLFDYKNRRSSAYLLHGFISLGA